MRGDETWSQALSDAASGGDGLPVASGGPAMSTVGLSLTAETVSVITCTGGFAVVESYLGQDYAFLTLNFTGSSASRIALTCISSPDGATWRTYPEHPERLTAVGDGCQLQFAATRSPARSTTATVSLRIDGGPEQSVQVDLQPWGSGAAEPRASGF